MLTYIARRLLLMIPTLIGITFLVFMLVALAPGGIGAALKVQGGNLQSQQGTALLQAYLEDRYGLDDPVIVQYVRWLGRISPVKLGMRDQWSPSGERLRAPREIKDPVLWRWYADALPTTPPVPPSDDAAPREDRIRAYRAADRAYADARQNYIASTTLLRQALVRYAREAGLESAIDRDGQVRLKVLRRYDPDKSLAAWAEVERLGRESLTTYARAMDARANLVSAFRAKPYDQAGVAIIPGVVSIGLPDFGVAYSRQRPVIDLIAAALPVTLLINIVAFPIIYLVAIPGGMLAATKRGSFFDTGMGAMFIALYSFPVVLAGVFAIGFLASKEYLGAFPVAGLHSNGANAMPYLPKWGSDGSLISHGYLLDLLWHLCLPVLCLVYGSFAVLSKQTRAAMLDNFNADYVRTAKAKGVAGKDVVLRHVFRNSLLPLITMFVTIFPAMLSGSVVIERIFTIPGMGSLILDAINLRDRELILANTLMIAMVNLLALLLADILYAIADPRVSYE